MGSNVSDAVECSCNYLIIAEVVYVVQFVATRALMYSITVLFRPIVFLLCFLWKHKVYYFQNNQFFTTYFYLYVIAIVYTMIDH